MRILVTAHSIAPCMGGLRYGVLGICQGLVARGHKVVLLTTNADGDGLLDVPLDVSVFEQDVDVIYYPAQHVAFGNVLSIPMVRALKSRVPEFDLILIHSLYQLTSTVAAHYARKFKVPYVLRPHGSLDPFLVFRRRQFLKLVYINLFEKRNFRSAAAIQYSSKMEEGMTGRFMDIQTKSLILSEGIDSQYFSNQRMQGAFRTTFPDLLDKVLVLFLGRFHQKKGIELLIASFNLVATSCPNAHLILAGSGDRDYVKLIEDMIQGIGLSKRVTIVGHIDDEMKLAAMADADMFVLPSFGENFGIAVVEAMACGLPVLISDKVGIWREVMEGDAGVVTTCETTEVAGAIEKLVNDPELRLRLGQNGKKLVQEQFDIEEVAKRMETAYQSLCVNAA